MPAGRLSGTPRGHLTAPLAALLLAAVPAAIAGQTPSSSSDTAQAEAADRFPFAAPLASPLEPRTRVAPVHVSREDRQRWVGLVDLGDAFPFWIAAPDSAGHAGARLAASLAGGVFSRFDLEGNGNEFIEAHYRVGVRLRAALGELEARAELYHVSSHLGDEFLVRTGREPISTSREGVELLVGGRPTGSLRLYGGPGLLLRSTEELDPASLRLGAEWLPDGPRWGPFRPYAAGELFTWQEVGWDPLLAAEAGLVFGAGRYRVGLVAGAGPSRAEQFLREDETLYGLSFSASF